MTTTIVPTTAAAVNPDAAPSLVDYLFSDVHASAAQAQAAFDAMVAARFNAKSVEAYGQAIDAAHAAYVEYREAEREAAYSYDGNTTTPIPYAVTTAGYAACEQMDYIEALPW